MTETERRAVRHAELRQFDSMRRDYAVPLSGPERARHLALSMCEDPEERQGFVRKRMKSTDPVYERQMGRMELAQALHDELRSAEDPASLEIKRRLMAIEFSDDLRWVVTVARDHGLVERADAPGPRSGSGMARHDDILMRARERLMRERLPDPGDPVPAPMSAMQALEVVSTFAFGSEGSKAKRLQRRGKQAP
ncbi:MAG: hypothetical protein EON90_12900 [Brevundimonas sp.]|nr:MAG: hypothetical protein EON90_12900 [Brevundimonas sp.]